MTFEIPGDRQNHHKQIQNLEKSESENDYQEQTS